MRLVMGWGCPKGGIEAHAVPFALLEARLSFENAEKECPAGGPGEGLDGREGLGWSICGGPSRPRWRLPACYLSVIQRCNVLCDRSQLRIGRDDLEVAARSSFAPQFAHFDDNVATHKAAELGNKATVAADD
jgi:hypothetical protein